ncbi:hypothetical protein GCM10010274_00540 [Streptomyces lavendofoliae]|uniref:Uncharacterized protein n=2 Tax=Streptomyces TaxID=1883 RepID=A0A918M175_9ACTN|nr:hypothetical protein [Streptomyces lavendofoliae]GGU18202.1 hypothetical protein GCM10010274_00540 [Streptomyces lavendofoliae]
MRSVARAVRRPLRDARAAPKLAAEVHAMSKRGNKRRARKKKGANHGKRPNA